MASERQSTQTDETSDSTSALFHSASYNSLMEANPAQSHLHDVRAPELVYNIDEETRMGLETPNDCLTLPSTETAVKGPKGKIVAAKPAAKEQSSASTPAPTGGGASFSALSFIASQYAESDNSSPRSVDSPAGFQEDHTGPGLVPRPPEGASGHTSDGFETTSIVPTPQAASTGPAAQAGEGEVCVEKVGGGGDAPTARVVAAETEKPVEEGPGIEGGLGRDGDARKDADPSKRTSGQHQGKEAGLEKGGDANTDVSDVKMDKDVKIEDANTDGKMDKEVKIEMDLNKDAVGDVKADADALSGEDKVAGKADPEDQPAAEPTHLAKDVADHVGKDAPDDASAAVSSEGVKQRPALVCVPAQDGALFSSPPEPMDTAEPMEVEDSIEEESEMEHSTEKQSKVEHSTEQQSKMEHSTEKQSKVEHSTEQQSKVVHSTEKQSKMEHSTEKQSKVEHSTEKQSKMEHSTEKQSKVEHSTEKQSKVEHSTEKQSKMEYSTEKQSKMEHSTEKQSKVEHSTEKQSKVEHSTEKQSKVEHSTEQQSKVEHSTEQQGEADNKKLTGHTDLVGEKARGEPVQPATDTPEGPRLAPDTEPVEASESEIRLLPDTDSVMSEDSKLGVEVGAATEDSRPGPTDSIMSEDSRAGPTVIGEDSRPAPGRDNAVLDSARLSSKLHFVASAFNMDSSVMSDDSRLMSNMDLGLSEDSKLMNMDSMMSSVLDEPSTSFAVKRPSAVVPFGENANSSMPISTLGMEGENSNFSFVDESSQSNSMFEKPSRPKRARRSSIFDIQDSKLDTEDGLQPFHADRVFEYQWPQDGGEWCLLQEQISEYLGVLSFKRKYPDLTRRTCDKVEKDFLREKGVVTETQSDLGLTAIRSEEVYDLMMKDYPDKYHEYATLLHEREKQKISDKHKEYEVAQPKLEKSKIADYMKKAAKSAAEYNRHLLREKREERLAFFDLQTFMIQYPEGRYKKLPPELTKPSSYPVALIPGQFQDHYCSYTSDELRYFPLNTALYDPPKKMSNTLAKPAGSSESSDDSEDKSGSSSDTSGSSDSETPAATAASATKGNNTADTFQPPSTPSTPIAVAAMATSGKRKSAKKGGKKASPTKTPVRSPGRPLKGKGKLVMGGKEGGPATVTSPLSSATAGTASPAPKKVKTEEDEDKDKCRICKNAVLFLKYKRVETKMIKCSECGKIAHPTCLDLTDKMVQVVTTYPWQCMECKTCVECMDPYDEDKMLFCDRCDRGYHTFCVGLRCLPTGRWECRSCKGVTETQKSRRGRPLKPT